MRKLKKFILFIPILLFFSCAEVYNIKAGGYSLKTGGGLGLISTPQEIQMGKSYVPLAVEQNNGLYPDKEVQEYINQLGLKIAKYAPRKLPYKFYVVNTDVVNAFALPGGFIFVNRGLILVLDKESQLAGVLGHELGHVNAKHHVKFMEKMLGINLIYEITASFLSDKSYGQFLLRLGKFGVQLLSLKWSRDQEREADKLGILFSYKAGYDPNGLLETFKIFEKLGKIDAPEWLLTHPLPKNRYREVKSIISKLKPKPNLIKDNPKFHRIKNKILHTKKSFDLFNLALKELSKGRDKVALRYLNQSIKLFPKNNASLTLRALIYAKNKRYRLAISDSVKASNIDKLYFSPHFIAGYSYFHIKDFNKAERYLNKAKRLIPSYPDPYYYLGRIYEYRKDYLLAYKYYKQALKLTDGKRGWENDAKLRLKRLEKILR